MFEDIESILLDVLMREMDISFVIVERLPSDSSSLFMLVVVILGSTTVASLVVTVYEK